jgi:sulfonate transport system permease protein
LIDPLNHARRRRHVSVPRALQRLAGPLLVLVLWQLLSSLRVIDPQTIPSPGKVASAFWRLTSDGTLPSHAWVSVIRVVKGLALGITAGLVLAVAAGFSRVGDNLVDANMAVLRAIPNFALLPVLIVWFGIDERPKVVLIALTVMVQIYINTYSAIRNVDASLVEAARTFGVSRIGLIRTVVLPGALPGFFVGLRLALTGAWLALIFAETINAPKGLGRMMTDAREYFQLDVIFVLLGIYAVMGLVAHALVLVLESRLLTWRRGFDGR